MKSRGIASTIVSGLLLTLAPAVAWGQAAARTTTPAAASAGAPPAGTPATGAATGTATAQSPAAGGGATQASGTAATAGVAPENQTGIRAAQEHVRRATAFFRAGDYEHAIEQFELANRAAPSADFWFNIARSYELLNQPGSAVEYYRRYLRDKVDPPDRAEVERRIADLSRLAEQLRSRRTLQGRTVPLSFEVTPRGATVFLDNREVGRAPAIAPQETAVGEHALRVTAPGMQEWRSVIRLRPGSPVTAFATLAPATQYRTRSGGHILSYILGGLGIASLGTGVGFGISAATQPACTMIDGCGRHTSAVFADVFFGLGGAFAASAVITWFVEAGASRTDRIAGAAATTAR